jgi:hypothetical protein
MEAQTVDALPPVAADHDPVRCLLAIELSKKSWIVAITTALSDKISRYTLDGCDWKGLFELMERVRARVAREVGRPVEMISFDAFVESYALKYAKAADCDRPIDVASGIACALRLAVPQCPSWPDSAAPTGVSLRKVSKRCSPISIRYFVITMSGSAEHLLDGWQVLDIGVGVRTMQESGEEKAKPRTTELRLTCWEEFEEKAATFDDPNRKL